MLLRFLPDEQLMNFVPFMKQAYYQSNINQKSVCLAGIVDCCLRLRTRMKYDGNAILLRLQIFEGLLESCMMMSLFDQSSIFLQSIYCEYLLMQMSMPSNYLYMPHDTILQLLLLSHNAILINAVCLFGQLYSLQLRIHEQIENGHSVWFSSRLASCSESIGRSIENQIFNNFFTILISCSFIDYVICSLLVIFMLICLKRRNSRIDHQRLN